MLRGYQPSELHAGNTCLRIAQQTKPATWMNSLNEIDNNQNKPSWKFIKHNNI